MEASHLPIILKSPASSALVSWAALVSFTLF